MQQEDYIERARKESESRLQKVQNLPWMISGMLFLIILIKVMLVARLDTNTALGIIQKSNPLDLAPAVIMAFLPAAGLGVATVVTYIHNNARGSVEKQRYWMLYCIIVALLSTIQNWILTVTQLCLPIIFYVPSIIRLLKRGWSRLRGTATEPQTIFSRDCRGQQYPQVSDSVLSEIVLKIRHVDDQIRTSSSVGDSDLLSKKRKALIAKYDQRVHSIESAWANPIEIAAIAVIGCVLLVSAPQFFTDKSWLPAEQIQLADKAVIGYVISSGDGWTSILLDSDRKLISVKSDQIRGRQLCTPKDMGKAHNERTIWGLKGKVNKYPKCTVQ